MSLDRSHTVQDPGEKPSSDRGPPHTRYSMNIHHSPPNTRQTYNVRVQRTTSPPPPPRSRHGQQTPPSTDYMHLSQELADRHRQEGAQKQYSHTSLNRPHRHGRHVTSPELHTSHTLPHPHSSRQHLTDGQSRAYSYVDPRGAQISDPHHPSFHHHSPQPDPYENKGPGDSGVDSDITLTLSSQASYDGRDPMYDIEHTRRRLSPHEMSGSQTDSTQGSEASHHKSRPSGRPSSGQSRKVATVRTLPKRPTAPNPSAMNRGEAWQLEEEMDRQGVADPYVTTTSHMDQALLPQKHYFPTSPSHSSHTPQASHHSPQPHTGAQHPAGNEDVPYRLHSGPPSRNPSRRSSISEPTVSPAHHHDDRPLSHHTSREFSPRNSSAVDPSYASVQRRGSYASVDSRRGSYASIDSNHSSGSYHTMSPSMRRSPSLPLKPSPNISESTGSRVVSVIGQQMVVAPEPGIDHVTGHKRASKHTTDHQTNASKGPSTRHRRHSTSDSIGRTRKKHQYEHVRAAHPYEHVQTPHPYEDMGGAPPPYSTSLTPPPSSQVPQPSPLAQGSQDSNVVVSPTSKRWKYNFLKRDNRPKSSPAPKRPANANDSKLNHFSKKNAGSVSSPAPSKRYSAGNILDEHVTRQEKQVPGRKRVSSPDIQLHTQMLSRYFPTDVKAAAGDLMEQSLSDSDGTPPAKRTGRTKSAGTVVLHKIAKKFSKMSMKSAAPDAGEGSDGSGGGGNTSWSKKAAKKKKKLRSNSVANLTDPDEPSRLTQSMEQLNDICRASGATPTGTPKMTRSSSKNRLTRRGSEPDLEGTMTTLFRSGSKRNLAADPTEALFDHIEQGQTEEVEQLLYSNTAISLTVTSEDDLLPLDLAAMLNHEDIAKLLLDKGAKDSTRFCRDVFSRFSRIASLLSESERELDSLQHELVTQGVSNSSAVKELERRLKKWEWKSYLYKKMKNTFDCATVPGPPAEASLHVTSSRSLTVTFTEPLENNGAVVTRYKIEWCRSEAFSPIVGEFVMTDLRSMEYAIPDLDKGESYFVRVSAYNMKGFGPTCLASPSSAAPSSWHDTDASHPRYEGKTDQMYTLSAELSMMLSQSPPISPASGAAGTPSVNRSTKTSLRKGITRLFGSNVKFHKSLKSGVYIASLIYSDDDNKVLVTQDDNIPILEVSDSDPSKAGPDFVWLAKVACTWEHIRTMCESSDNYTSSPAIQFRNKLLHAVLNLQDALGMQDLGLLHPVPYKDKHGASVFVLVQSLKEAKLPQTASSSFKWSPLPRLWKRRTPPSSDEVEFLPVPDQIVFDAHDIMAYHTNSTRKLSKGLYLGYLKGRSTVASIKVICSREYPNVLPYMKIRSNPNISRDEWEWFRSLSSPTPQPLQTPSGPQSLQETLLPRIETFLHNLGIAKEDIPHHQLYKHEAIELNEDITFLLLLPPAEQVCTPPGSTDHFAKLPDFVALPINTFEIMQLYTYQRNFMTKYSMVSARLEVELLASTQRMREAFSKEEVKSAKKTNEELEKYQERAEPAWKQMRWIEEAVQKGRDQSDSSDSLLSVAVIREGMNRARRVQNQAQLNAERRREREVAHSSHQQQSSHSSGYLRVFPAYNTGLVKGTSVKLFITVVTTTSEVIRLVVHQLEKARLDRGVPGNRLTEEDLTDFYLVGMTDTKEWIIDSRAYPLSLQASTRKLEVRRRSERLRMDEHVTSV